jgi:hypothetical protein
MIKELKFSQLKEQTPYIFYNLRKDAYNSLNGYNIGFIERKEKERIEAEEKIKREQAEKEQAEKEAREKLEAKKKYQNWLKKNGYTEENKNEFIINRLNNKFIIYKKLDELTIN